MSDRLPREVFLVLAAIGWIDGRLHVRELGAITDAATAEGIEGDDLASIERAIREPIELGTIDTASLTPTERLYTYAIARWIAGADGETLALENAALDVLGLTLRLTRKGRDAMDAAIVELSSRPETERPSRLDFAALKRAIAERVSAAASASADGRAGA